MTYKCKTYQGENRKYVNSMPYSNIKRVFLDNVSYEKCFKEIVYYLDEESPELLKKFMVKILSNPCDFTIAELEELFTGK